MSRRLLVPQLKNADVSPAQVGLEPKLFLGKSRLQSKLAQYPAKCPCSVHQSLPLLEELRRTANMKSSYNCGSMAMARRQRVLAMPGSRASRLVAFVTVLAVVAEDSLPEPTSLGGMRLILGPLSGPWWTYAIGLLVFLFVFGAISLFAERWRWGLLVLPMLILGITVYNWIR